MSGSHSSREQIRLRLTASGSVTRTRIDPLLTWIEASPSALCIAGKGSNVGSPLMQHSPSQIAILLTKFLSLRRSSQQRLTCGVSQRDNLAKLFSMAAAHLDLSAIVQCQHVSTSWERTK